MDPAYLAQVWDNVNQVANSLGNMTAQVLANAQAADVKATAAEAEARDIRQRMMNFQEYVLKDKNSVEARFENIEVRMNEVESGAGKGPGGRSLVDPRLMIPPPINGEPGIKGIAWREWS